MQPPKSCSEETSQANAATARDIHLRLALPPPVGTEKRCLPAMWVLEGHAALLNDPSRPATTLEIRGPCSKLSASFLVRARAGETDVCDSCGCCIPGSTAAKLGHNDDGG